MEQLKKEDIQIDPETCTIDELDAEINRLRAISEEYHDLEQALKIQLNSSYGAMACPYFYGFNVHIAEAITKQGQHLSKFASKCLDHYIIKMWPNDTRTHEEMGLTRVSPIDISTATVYMDTDSVCGTSNISYSVDGNSSVIFDTLPISSLYNRCTNECGEGERTLCGHESANVPNNIKILNIVDGVAVYQHPKRIIKHKVTKPKWRLTTKSGRVVEMTNDHSAIVVRNGEQKVVKPYDILLTDKVLTIVDGNTPEPDLNY